MTRHYHDLYGEESKDQKIKRLYAEIERLREQERKMTNHALERMEEIERLREALKIFAIYADYLDENYGDHPDHYVSKGFKGEIITFGDFRKARSALQQKDSE